MRSNHAFVMGIPKQVPFLLSVESVILVEQLQLCSKVFLPFHTQGKGTHNGTCSHAQTSRLLLYIIYPLIEICLRWERTHQKCCYTK